MLRMVKSVYCTYLCVFTSYLIYPTYFLISI